MEGGGGWGMAKLNKPRRGEMKGIILAVGEACKAILVSDLLPALKMETLIVVHSQQRQ